MSIVIAGHLCVDLKPHAEHLRFAPGTLTEIGPLEISLGGCVSNTARALAHLGHTVTITANIGDDPLATTVRELLAEIPGIIGSPTTIPAAHTSYSLVLEPTGIDRSFWHHPGANTFFDGSAIDPTGVQLLHVGYPSLLPAIIANNAAGLTDVFRRAHTAGATTSVDLAVVDETRDAGAAAWEQILRNVLPLVDIATPSADDLRSALQRDGSAADFAQLLLDWGVAVAAVSDGAAGVAVRTASTARLRAAGAQLAPLADGWADHSFHQDAIPPARVVTTNAAGDTATAGFLSGVIARLAPRAAAHRSVAAAAAHIAGEKLSGAIPAGD